ncbi:MAG: hypothetical protein GX871_08550 [Microbacteriaceae bacterium]|jgi:hypothetical protein|nr:hypothetical protein [Microbacteriaceae bacterium]HOA86317.1 hypothetical protein [Microbacteriaceae bacterium]HPZ35185.1 hypothetical protein [Microbacteriaceae bacterium]
MSRTLNVVRMQLVNRQTFVWVPLIVLGGSLLLTLAIYAILQSSGITEPKFGGGAQAPLWYFLVVGIQSLTLTFPFSQAMSVTRREFYVGTVLTAALTSAILAIVFVLGGLLEQATGGWGMNGYFFHLDWVWQAGPAGAALFFFILAMLFFVTGFGCALVYRRFGTLGLSILLVGIGAVLVALLWLIGQANAWAAVFTWFAQQGAVSLSLWMLALAAVIGVLAFAGLRRATP